MDYIRIYTGLWLKTCVLWGLVCSYGVKARLYIIFFGEGDWFKAIQIEMEQLLKDQDQPQK